MGQTSDVDAIAVAAIGHGGHTVRVRPVGQVLTGGYGRLAPVHDLDLRRRRDDTRSFICPTTSSARRITGRRYRSLRLKARIVKSNISWGLDGHRAMIS
jgi:hypothetical protein